jgi:hypothetical protein
MYECFFFVWQILSKCELSFGAVTPTKVECPQLRKHGDEARGPGFDTLWLSV